MVKTKGLVNNLSYLSFKTGNKTPANCINTLISCLFESFILSFNAFIRSFIHCMVTLPKLSFIKLIIAYALYFLFCQFPLSLIFGKYFITS